ncbi:MAG TPA: glycosyltransferase family 1 protein, partial [Candidatus Saccharimonas sp.]|nr:glycosyltransferase family 1 protein [Candidatus Saccharimonas sp.]
LLTQEVWDDYQPGAANFHKVLSPFRPYGLGEQLGLARQLYNLRPDLVHFAAPNTPLLYWGRHTTMVHDLILLDYSTARGSVWRRAVYWMKRLVFGLMMWVVARSARQLFTPTEYVRDQLLKRYHLQPERVTATRLGIDLLIAAAEPIDRFETGPEYALYVGNCYPYKNVARLVEAFAQLASERPGLKLVLVGRDDHFRKLVRDQVDALGLHDRVVFTGAISDGALRGLYEHAKLYVHPSLAEGFGLQALEAMTAGVPVLAARSSCLPEICGEAAEYFDPHSTAELAEKMRMMLDDEARRTALEKLGRERVKEFSWQAMSRQTWEALRNLLP